ncbi:hypothetical protein AAH994_15020 [Weeksellaceae bacterium A-14]
MIQFFEVNSSFNISWGYKIEPIFRILSKRKYLDDFFENGDLFISSFENFKNYDDEMQGDISEGQSLIGGFDKEGNGNHIFYEGGRQAFILCATKVLSESVIKDFNGVGAIKIVNSVLFAREIAKKLPFVNTGIEGDCIYVDSKVQHLENEKNELFQKINFSDPLMINQTVTALTSGVELFMKHKKYEHQQEHRLAWFSERKIDNSIVVNCPEAIEYCEKIIF